MKIEAGKTYTTRNGTKAVITSNFQNTWKRPEGLVIKGHLVFSNGKIEESLWDKDGRYSLHFESQYDIVRGCDE